MGSTFDRLALGCNEWAIVAHDEDDEDDLDEDEDADDGEEDDEDDVDPPGWSD